MVSAWPEPPFATIAGVCDGMEALALRGATETNPAVTIARSLLDTFAGIAPAGVPAFIAAQLAGMVAAVLTTRRLWPAAAWDRRPERTR